MNRLISTDELFRNCFSGATLEKVKIYKVHRGPYVAQLSWDVEGLPYGEQIVWVMYSPKSREQLDRLADDVTALMGKVNGKIVVIDGFDPRKMDLCLEMMLLSDGRLAYNVMTLTLEDGATGHVAVFTGQGRSLDTEDPDLPGLLHTIVANLFPVKELKDDPVIKAGREKVENLQRAAVEHGVKVGHMTHSMRRSSSY